MTRPREVRCPSALRRCLQYGQPIVAAHVVQTFVRIRLGDWREVARGPGGGWALHVSGEAMAPLSLDPIPLGFPDHSVHTVVELLLRQMTRPIGRRVSADPACRRHLVALAAQAFVDGDLELQLGLMRLLIGRRRDHLITAGVLGVHPKSLVRMLGRDGNPSARLLSRLMRLLQQNHDARLTVRSPLRETKTRCGVVVE